MVNPYRELLSNPGVIGLLLASFVVRLPQAMTGIGIITMLAEQRGLYWLAGSVSATFTIANALIGPHVSKFVDQRGQSKVLPVITALSIVMLMALLVAAYMKLPVPLLFILAALAGTMPNMPAMIRARWTQLFRGKPQLHTVFSLDTALTELSVYCWSGACHCPEHERICRSRAANCLLVTGSRHDRLSFTTSD